MTDEIDERWERRDERLAVERKRANKLGIAAVVIVLVLAVAGCAWWAIARRQAADEARRAAEVAASGLSPTETVTPGAPDEDDTAYPPGTFEIGDEVRVKKGKDVINQRKEPRVDAFVVTTLGWPQRVRVLDRTIPEGDRYVWYLVVSWDGTNEGPEGWVRGDLLEAE